MTVLTGSNPPATMAVFRRPNFTKLWTAQFVSTIGDALNQVAASILIFRLTGSVLSVGLMMMATAVPSLFIGLIAGVYVDRYDRKKIMVACDFTRAIIVCLIPVLARQNIAWLYIIVMLTAAISTFFNPAHDSVLPEVAPDEELAAANSFMAISSFGSTAVGFALSGLLASLASIDIAFYLDGLTFLTSAILIATVRLPKMEVNDNTNVKAIFQNLGEGFKYVKSIAILRSFLIVSIFYAIATGLFNALLLPFTIRALGANEFVFGVQEGLYSVAYVIASLIMAKVADRLREGQWVSLGILVMGITNIFYAYVTSIPLAILLAFIGGIMNAPKSIGGRLITQRNTTREIRGRVTSISLVINNILFMIGMATAGLADLFDVRTVMLAAGLLTLLAALVSFVMPGIGQPAAHWKRSIALLRQVETAPGLAAGRAATPADLEALAVHLPVFASLSANERQNLATQTWVQEASEGTAVLRHHQISDDAYFIINGRAVAGREEDGEYRILEVLNCGDFFGEIAALTNAPRTADVVAEEPTLLLQVPARTLREMSKIPELNRLFLSKMTERMIRMNMIDIAMSTSLDQQSLRELRTPAVQPT